MRSWPIRSAGSGRTTSTTTTCPAGGRWRNPRIPTVSSCGCSRTPGWWGSRCSRSFLVAAIAAAMPARRRQGLEAFVAGAALLPLVVWVIHGSIDWFWEIPALSGPALGFLGVAGALGAASTASRAITARRAVPAPDVPPANGSGALGRPGVAALTIAAAVLAVLAAVVVLGFPYLSVREVSIAATSVGPIRRRH